MNKGQINFTFLSFVKSQFDYCPPIWIFSTKHSLTIINDIHERSLLSLTNDVDIHQSCIQKLMIEVYKFAK